MLAEKPFTHPSQGIVKPPIAPTEIGAEGCSPSTACACNKISRVNNHLARCFGLCGKLALPQMRRRFFFAKIPWPSRVACRSSRPRALVSSELFTRRRSFAVSMPREGMSAPTNLPAQVALFCATRRSSRISCLRPLLPRETVCSIYPRRLQLTMSS